VATDAYKAGACLVVSAQSIYLVLDMRVIFKVEQIVRKST